MRTQIKTSLVILVALVVVMIVMQQSLNLGSQLLPHALSGIPTTTYPPREPEPALDGHMVGYDFVRIAEVLDDPCPQWHVPFLEAGWEESDWDTAKWVIYRESRCQAGAFNGVDAGLLQINEFHKPLIESLGLRFPDDLFDGDTNLWVANVLWTQYGWEPWKFRGVIPGE